MRRDLIGIALSLAALTLLGGCLGIPGPGWSANGTDATTTTTEAWGTERVFVTPVENESLVGKYPDATSVAFENLSERRKEVFLEALRGDGVRFGTDESNPFDWQGGGVEFVRYEGTWYRVHVQIT